jgi:hypothetical protein
VGIWEQIQGGRPDDPATKGPQTRRVASGETLRIWPLESQASWYVTHFLGQRTRPCLGDVCLCKRVDRPVRTRWTGWVLAAERWRPLCVRLVALTENCWDSCPEIRDPTFNLRGRLLILRRPKGGARGKVWAQVDQLARVDGHVPELPYTQRDQLLRVWFSERDGYDEFTQYAHSEWLHPKRWHDAQLPSSSTESEVQP